MKQISRSMTEYRVHRITFQKILGFFVYFKKYIMIKYGARKENRNVLCDGELKSNLQWPNDVIYALSQNGLPLLNTNCINERK